MSDAVRYPRNRLLAALPAKELAVLQPHLERVPLKARQVLHHPHLPIEHVYFVERGLVSVTARMSDGRTVEAWLIGCEGMAGIPVLLGAPGSPHRRLVRLEGSALRIESSRLLSLLDERSALREILLRYVHSVLVQSAQSAACNAVHSVHQRLARWLLMARERAESDILPLTHDSLSRLLGVRRASVTKAVGALEEQGMVDQRRGGIRILDARKLEEVSCGCHRTISAATRKLYRAGSRSGAILHASVEVLLE